MESFLSRFKNALVLIAILFAQIIALATQVRRPENPQNPDGKSVRLVRLWAYAVVSPFERASTGTGHGLRNAWANYVALRGVRRQNDGLEHQLAQLRLERAALAEDALQGQRLQKLLDFKQHYVASTMVAQVIGASASDQGRLLTLDKGARDGLKPDMAVITPDGIVGKLRDVFPTTAQLQLISDPTSGAGVLLESTRIRAILRGSPAGLVEINNLTADDRIKPGERVLTSGGDQVFPRGLPVGTIEQVRPDPEHQPYTTIRIHPAANLARLDEVLIITALGNALDPGTRAELAADAAQHAADITAERLPSLHENQPGARGAPGQDAAPDPNATADAPPPADNSTGLVPKPPPALHPDRYSPNAAPPADQLTPGAPKPPQP